jgi:hypothetical protein
VKYKNITATIGAAINRTIVSMLGNVIVISAPYNASFAGESGNLALTKPDKGRFRRKSSTKARSGSGHNRQA